MHITQYKINQPTFEKRMVSQDIWNISGWINMVQLIVFVKHSIKRNSYRSYTILHYTIYIILTQTRAVVFIEISRHRRPRFYVSRKPPDRGT